METEKLAIFDEDMHSMGVETRQEVHARGYWHQTFHCWFLQRDGDTTYLLFQRRAMQKKDFPGKLDITAAGHLLAGEQVEDGIREITEELGIALAYDDLQPIGIIKEQIILDRLIDREFCHVYLYNCPLPIDSFVLQTDEVAGIIRIEVNAFAHFIDNRITTVQGAGYCIESDGSKSFINTTYTRDDFCPHSQQYFLKLVCSISR
ncbi:MAG: NUDIX domain-containing protein [Ktedonobacteraceae bacterium]